MIKWPPRHFNTYIALLRQVDRVAARIAEVEKMNEAEWETELANRANWKIR